jgi:uncharacterized membrane protein YdjX (TVP38/TMEM64 family)
MKAFSAASGEPLSADAPRLATPSAGLVQAAPIGDDLAESVVALRRFWVVPAGLILFNVALFAVVEALRVPVLADPEGWSESERFTIAAAGVALLAVDVVIPVPSSFVMATLGDTFGFWRGALLSTAGAVGATLAGFAIGRRGEGAVRRFIDPAERDRVGRLFQRWGPLAIVVTRPVPILAETAAIVAGTTSLRWRHVVIAAVVGGTLTGIAFSGAGAGLGD